MRISFIVPTYNRCDLVQETVKSILRQPYKQIEVIVVDDASTDDTPERMKVFTAIENFYYFRLSKNRGQNFARNFGIEKAGGEIVTIVDSDDEDYGTDLKPLTDFLQSHPHIGGVFTTVISKSNGRPICDLTSAGIEFGFSGFIDGTYRGEYQAFLRKAFLKGRVFEENLGIRRSCTLLTWLRLGKELRFSILDLKTKLYNDIHVNRMGNIQSLLKDSDELLTCNKLVLQRYGKEISQVNQRFFNSLNLKEVYYTLLTSGRSKAIRRIRTISLLRSNIKEYVAVLCSIALGPNLTRNLSLFLK